LNAISAAKKLGGDVVGIITGSSDEHIDQVAEEAKKLVQELPVLPKLKLKQITVEQDPNSQG